MKGKGVLVPKMATVVAVTLMTVLVITVQWAMTVVRAMTAAMKA